MAINISPELRSMINQLDDLSRAIKEEFESMDYSLADESHEVSQSVIDLITHVEDSEEIISTLQESMGWI